MSGYMRRLAARGAGVRPASVVAVIPPRSALFSIPASTGAPSPRSPSEAETPGNSRVMLHESASPVSSAHVGKLTSPSIPVQNMESKAETVIPIREANVPPKPEGIKSTIPLAQTNISSISARKAELSSPRNATQTNETKSSAQTSASVKSPDVEMKPSVQSSSLQDVPTVTRQQSSSLDSSDKDSALPKSVAVPGEAKGPTPIVQLEPAVQLEVERPQHFPGSTELTPLSTEVSSLPPERERRARSQAQQREVKVTIGQVTVQVEAAKPAAPAAKVRSNPSDPFASLAFARRGWRTIF